jgi:hypothetical protein
LEYVTGSEPNSQKFADDIAGSKAAPKALL